ncbi:LEA type 2 family protein [Pseudomonas sp. CDFA 602]|uniref:LEA type 2 family protein n=1 Tax=Pseudomonas californiensis TaxID=2829823 RepID=UPI001E5EC5FF|nr:LEA type 2 family protein [Pseudomonas californiensis]MCD5995840.1 LEA type 2 family protein [Pseudomonas californiensis]MCD6001524.1 LEA type 2 family protein [Pseudomonas californiensis]
MSFQAHITRTLSLALIMFGLSGCSIFSFDSFQDPQVHLLKVQVVKARLTQQDFKLHFEVDNPNDSRLLVRGLQYKIMLNDVILADGKSSDWFFVPGHSQKTFVVPIRTNLWRHARYIAQLLKKPDQPIHYRLEGKLKTGVVFRHSIRIGRSGDMAPEELIQDLR